MRWPVRWGGREKKGPCPKGSCMQQGIYLRVRDSLCVRVYTHASCCNTHGAPPDPPIPSPPPAEEGDLYLAPGATGVSGFLTSQISPASPPQALPPPSSAQEVGWPWGFSLWWLAPSAVYYLGRGSRSWALGRWLQSQQWREAERARRSPMSQLGKVPPCPYPAPAQSPGTRGSLLAPATSQGAGGEVHGDDFQL